MLLTGLTNIAIIYNRFLFTCTVKNGLLEEEIQMLKGAVVFGAVYQKGATCTIIKRPNEFRHGMVCGRGTRNKYTSVKQYMYNLEQVLRDDLTSWSFLLKKLNARSNVIKLKG